MLTRVIISGCLSSKFAGALVDGRMTGLSVRTLILVRKLAGGTPGSIIIPVRLALISGKEIVARVILVSSLTGCSSAGCTLLATGLSHAKTVRGVGVGFVSLLILRTSLGW